MSDLDDRLDKLFALNRELEAVLMMSLGGYGSKEDEDRVHKLRDEINRSDISCFASNVGPIGPVEPEIENPSHCSDWGWKKCVFVTFHVSSAEQLIFVALILPVNVDGENP